MRAQGVNLELKWQKSSRILEMEDDYILVTDGNNTYEIKLEDDESCNSGFAEKLFWRGSDRTGIQQYRYRKISYISLGEGSASLMPRPYWKY